MLKEVCDVFKEAYRRGWITTRDGNASLRRPEQDWFYVTLPLFVRTSLSQKCASSSAFHRIPR